MAIFVNDKEIMDAEIGREMQYHPAGSREDAWFQAARSLVVRQLLLQRATEAGICNSPDAIAAGQEEEEIIDRLLRIEVNVPEADETTCRRYYQRHSGRFVDRDSGRTMPFERARALIRDYLQTRAMRVAVAEYIGALSNHATIRGFDMGR